MEEWQQRVVDECEELGNKVQALGKFRDTDTYRDLPLSDRGLLTIQLDVMRAYRNVLNLRISSFDEGTQSPE
jgi:hypothetical protein